jgi:hypothetical protein
VTWIFLKRERWWVGTPSNRLPTRDIYDFVGKGKLSFGIEGVLKAVQNVEMARIKPKEAVFQLVCDEVKDWISPDPKTGCFRDRVRLDHAQIAHVRTLLIEMVQKRKVEVKSGTRLDYWAISTIRERLRKDRRLNGGRVHRPRSEHRVLVEKFNDLCARDPELSVLKEMQDDEFNDDRISMLEVCMQRKRFEHLLTALKFNLLGLPTVVLENLGVRRDQENS